MHRAHGTRRSVGLLLGLGLLLALPGCKRSRPAPAASASATASVVKPPPLVSQAVPPRMRLPVGPRLAIVAGAGVGPIRIGATRETIERLMEAPCEEATETLCRYVTRAVEFRLKDGKTDQIRVHQQQRPAGGKDPNGQPRLFGVFNGFIPPGASFGMLPAAIQELLGPAKRVEQVAEPGIYNTRQLHYYEGMVLEFDMFSNGNLILGGARIPE